MAENHVARRWSGHVCPDCRFVFRVPRDHDGKGLVCPSCRRLLKLPKEGEVLPPLVWSPAKAPDPDSLRSNKSEVDSPPLEKRKKKRKSPQESNWEQPEKRSVSQKLNTGFVWAGLIAMMAITGVIAFFLNKGPETKPYEAADSADPNLLTTATPSLEPAPPPSSTPGSVDLKGFLETVEPIVKQFLDASDISEVLPLVYQPETVKHRLLQRWPNGQVKAERFLALGSVLDVELTEKTGSVPVQTSDQQDRRMTFIHTPDGWKVDWESWTIWNEMSWEEFRSEKPTSPVLFRAFIAETSYYNFDFSNDRDWQSYRILSADREPVLYGYVARGTQVHTDAGVALGDAKESPVILMLRFKADSSHPQVIIDRVVAKGWVEPKSVTEP